MPSDARRTLTLICRKCYRRSRFVLPDLPGRFECPRCHEAVTPSVEGRLTPEGAVRRCLACGCAYLYAEKDFDGRLGCLILLAAVALFIGFGKHKEAIFFLVGAALADGILYLMVRRRVICYRCLAEHRGFPDHPEHREYDLGTASRFSDERKE